MNARALMRISGACGVLASAISTTLAQDVGEVAEVVIVTGSYIRGTPEDAALPVDVVSSEELEKIGAPTTLDLIKSLSVSNGVLGDTNQFDSRAQGSEGAGTINLRGLGPQRTLVLLNGRRMVANPFSDAVDTNLIPMAAIGRIEILKDGAAATYGSDAIGGVINFITKDRLNGLELGADYRYVDGAEGDYTASISYGWRGERARALLSAGYQHRSELEVTDRDWAFPAFDVSPEGGWSGAGNPSGFLVGPGSVPPTATNPLGVFGTAADPSCAALGGVPSLSATNFPLCNWQYTVFDNLIEKENRYQLYAQLDFDLTDSTTLHLEGLYANTKTPEWRTSPSYAVLQGPTPGSTLYFVPRANPGFDDFIAQNPTITTVQGLTLPSEVAFANGIALPAPAFRPFALGGNPLYGYRGVTSGREFTAYRLSAGLSGRIGEDLGWDVAVTYMEEEGERESRDTVASRLQRALRGLGGPNCTGNTPGENGCLWFNPFGNAIPGGAHNGVANPGFTGAGDNDNPDLINWMFPVQRNITTTDILAIDVVLNGSTGWTLGGGDVAWALGAQYRENGHATELTDLQNLELNPCVDSPDGGPSTCAAPTGPFVFLGGFYEHDVSADVHGVFGELRLPFTSNLEAQLAARYEDYGGAIGDTFDPKLSLRWQVTDWLALRGSVGSTFRGPPVDVTGQGSVTSLQNIAGTFRAVDTFDNPALEPESADTFNVGAIVRTSGFSASLDYWSFDFENPIVVEPVGGIVSALFPAGAPNRCNDPQYAGIRGRFTFGGDGTCSTGNISRLRVGWVNGAPVKTSGLDLIAQFDWDDVLGGAVALGANLTYVLEYDVDAQVVEGVQVSEGFDAVGFLNYQTTAIPLPEWKGNVFLEYANGAHNLRWVTNYIDGYTDQRTFAVNPTLGKEIDEFITHDLNYRVELPWDVRLVAAVDNVFDEDPPFVRLELAYDPFTASALGRTFKVGLTKTFANGD